MTTQTTTIHQNDFAMTLSSREGWTYEAMIISFDGTTQRLACFSRHESGVTVTAHVMYNCLTGEKTPFTGTKSGNSFSFSLPKGVEAVVSAETGEPMTEAQIAAECIGPVARRRFMGF